MTAAESACGFNNVEKPAGIILCGGRSRRMGQDKSSLEFGPETLLQRVCRLTIPATRCLIVVAAADQQLPSLPDQCIVVRDPFPNEGPLAGFLTGLRQLQFTLTEDASNDVWPDQNQTVWVSSCDSPFVDAAAIASLNQLVLRRPETDAAVPKSDGRAFPLNAVYRRQVITHVQACLEQNQRSMKSLLSRLNVFSVPTEENLSNTKAMFRQHFLMNINTQQDLELARDHLQNCVCE